MKPPITVEDIAPIDIQRLGAEGQGVLSVTEAYRHVPYAIARTFAIAEVPEGAKRGYHAHKNQNQFLAVLQGQVEVLAKDGVGERRFLLTPRNEALHVPPGLWLELTFLEEGSVLLVQCDKPFDEADYLREWDQFLAWRSTGSTPLRRTTEPVKLNVGHGGHLLPGYINIDKDTLDHIRARCPQTHFSDDLVVEQWSLFDLPCPDASIDEIRADRFIQNLPFIQERLFFQEVCRVLRPGGKLILRVPDFKEVAKIWLVAADDWRDFYRDDAEADVASHWFDAGSLSLDDSWGNFSTIIYGRQDIAGQFQTNCYSEKKLHAICARLGLTVETVNHFCGKGDQDPILELIAVKG